MLLLCSAMVSTQHMNRPKNKWPGKLEELQQQPPKGFPQRPAHWIGAAVCIRPKGIWAAAGTGWNRSRGRYDPPQINVEPPGSA